MRDELKAKYPEAWEMGKREAQQAYEWIVEETLPSAIPTTQDGIAKLVDDITPMAMDRLNGMLKEQLTGPTAFPKDLFVAIEQAFREELTWKFAARAGPQDPNRFYDPAQAEQRAWDAGQKTADLLYKHVHERPPHPLPMGEDEARAYVREMTPQMVEQTIRSNFELAPVVEGAIEIDPKVHVALTQSFTERLTRLLTTAPPPGE
jgi:hypothetical protein